MEKNVKIVFEHLLERIHGPAWKVREPEIALLLKRTALFEPPTIEEVETYLRSMKVRDPKGNAEKWHNFYESKGWMIGKNKMKNWKSAVNTWKFEKNNNLII
jgi:hypothetical protein